MKREITGLAVNGTDLASEAMYDAICASGRCDDADLTPPAVDQEPATG